MNLPFKTKINGKPTHFMEKIIRGAFWEGELTKEVADAILHEDFDSSLMGDVHSKLHTIREDKADRWSAGKMIHMCIHNRTKKRFQFAPEIKVASIQKIKIIYERREPFTNRVWVYVDDQWIARAIYLLGQLQHYSGRLGDLASNDGFDSVNDFFEFFDKDFSGKIIHWTDLKYR